MTMTAIDGCRACGAAALVEVLDLGRVPLANSLLRAEQLDDEEPRFPLTLVFCERCALAQLRETVDPELLFGDYVYFSSFSETMLAHCARAAAGYVERLALGPDSLVVEIASNDGYMLRNFVDRGVPVLGIDPARNVARVANERGVPTLAEFFGEELARRLAAEGRRADLLLANNVLPHVAETDGVVAGIALLLAPHGTAVIECPHLLELIDRRAFDTIYHEHLCYFSLLALVPLFARHGLTVVDVERLEIHGGSLRVSVRHAAAAGAPAPAVAELLELERSRGLDGPGAFHTFGWRVHAIGRALTAELARRKAAGQSLAAYGASAKGSTLMSTFAIGGETLDFVADRSTVKQGLYTPGNHLPIVAPVALVERRPDAVLLLTWNFADEIVRQQAAYLDGGGVFLVPIPELRVVGARG